MSEKEIRRIIGEVCGQLDRQARRAVGPVVIGAGLTLGGCVVDDPTPVYGYPTPDSRPMVDAGTDGLIPRDFAIYSAPDAVYMAPWPDGSTQDRGALQDKLVYRDILPYGVGNFPPELEKKVDAGGAAGYGARRPG